MELKANILRIERLSLSDGKGMRTVVFFKGCPLRCAWCSTPESQSGQREVYYMKERCTGCGNPDDPVSEKVGNRIFAGAKKRERS